jgi:hypothetical protein
MTRSGYATVSVRADDESVHWASLIAVVLLSWLGIALVVGTVVGHGIAFGTCSDLESRR